MKIEKKTWPEAFQRVLDGDKTFEIRLADWECNPGDTLILREWDPKTAEYTGRQLEKKVTYVAKLNKMNKYFKQEDIDKYGLQVIAIK